jgi:hypothetical protein
VEPFVYFEILGEEPVPLSESLGEEKLGGDIGALT